ncbi:MAG TPA: SAM-dependent methyltransferase [Burkholderiales bacterium]|nr:SAM-dependent methyltransferase [Burkholderiales bacterium]
MPTAPRRPDLPEPSEDARRHSDRLTQSIRREIDAAGGWIGFARFMELALYAPGLGYYVAGAAKLGAEGDFVTAPEISPLFGRTLARQIAQLLERSGGQVLELGAGSGTMAADVLGELQNIDRLPRRYQILETSPQLVERQRQTLQRRQPALKERVEWISALPELFDGVVIANEVLDALPVHVVAWRKQGLFERGVSWKDGFVWSERFLPPGTLRSAAGQIAAGAEYVSEISVLAPALVRSLAAALRKGALLLIDYGFGRREYYHPQRAQGTLMCHYRHRAHDDAFFLPGLQDLTAHVDFTAVAEAGIDAGMKILGYTTQAQFLVNSGITQLLEQQSADQGSSRIALTAGVQKLLSPAEMGELFKVIALGRGIDGALIGFASGDKSRLL